MATTLKSLCRQYGYTDQDTEQVAILDLCLKAAIQYFFNADIRPPYPDEEDPMYDLGVLMLCVYWYDNRATVLPGTAPAGPVALGISTICWQHGKNIGPEDTLKQALEYARGGDGE